MKWKMIIGGKYELGEVVGENQESRTFAARETETGRSVLVHHIFQGAPEGRKPSLHELAQSCIAGRGGVIDKWSMGGADYVVTEVKRGLGDTREYLERAMFAPPPAPKSAGEDRFTRVGAWRVPPSIASPTAAPPPSPPVPRQQAPEPPGSLTNMFQAQATAPPPLPPQPSQTTEAPGGFTSMFQAPATVPPPPPPTVSKEPGEFTRMFQASPPGAAAAVPAAPPQEPGGFTKMFQAPEPVASAPPATPHAKSEPGEFTRYFQSSLGSGPVQETWRDVPAPAPVVSPPPTAAPLGEYTRLFQMPAAPTAPAQPGSGATGAFVTPSYAPPPQAPVQAGPSDFTRVVQPGYPVAAEARPSEPVSTPAPRPAQARPRVPVGLLILLAALGILAIVIILVFALKH